MGCWRCRARRVDFKDAHVAFRLPFTTTRIRGRDHKIGTHEHVIKVIVLDVASENFPSNFSDHLLTPLLRHIWYLPTSPSSRRTGPYLHKYLETLVHASHRILFSLPEIDDARQWVGTGSTSTIPLFPQASIVKSRNCMAFLWSSSTTSSHLLG